MLSILSDYAAPAPRRALYDNDDDIHIPTASLRSCEYSKNDELCINKIHYRTVILYLNYKNNVYKVENLNEKSGR